MTGAKAWRQKGTGRARVGALSVPHRRGGGAAFGPTPRAYTFKVNRKARRRALRSALSVHADRGSVAVVEAAAYDAPSTKTAATALAKWGPKEPTLLAVGPGEDALVKSFRNIEGVLVMPAAGIGVADVLGAASLVASEAALEVLASRSARGRPEGGRRLMDARQVIIEPVVSEKSYALMADGKYTFRIDDRAHKTQVSHAVEEIFGVTVVRVRTMKVHSKPKRRGMHSGRTRGWRKAIVQLAPGDRIELFEGAAVAD